MMWRLALVGFLFVPIVWGQPFWDSKDARKIWGRPIENCAPSDGQMLVWNAANMRYQCGTPAGGGDVVGGSTSGTGELAAYANTSGKSIGRSFVSFSGPNASVKVFTLPNANASILTTDSAVTVGQGGTGITSGTSGGVLYFSSASALGSSAALGSGQLVMGGGAGAPPSTSSNLTFNTGTNVLSVTGAVNVGQAGSATGEVNFNGTTSGTVTIKPANTAGTWTLTLPTSAGSSGQFLRTDGAGVTTWATAGGAGAGLYPFTTNRDSDTQVTLGPDCSPSQPCVYRVGDATSSVSTSGTVSTPSGSGTVRLGISSTGTLTAWHNLTALTCGGSLSGACVGSTSSWPSGSIPLAECVVSSGTFDSAGCTDVRPLLSRDLYSAGSGLSLTGSTFSIGPSVVTFSSGTGAPPATCTVGETYLRTSTNQAYECTSTDTFTETTGGGGGGITSLNSQTGATQTFANDTNVTITSSGDTHTLGWSGQLAVGRGGTGLSSGTSGGIPYFSATSTMASSAALGSNLFVFGGGAGSAPFTNSNIAATPASSLVTITGNTASPRVHLVGAGSGFSPTLDLDHIGTSGSAGIGFRYANSARMGLRYTQTASTSTSRLSTYWNAETIQGGWTVSNNNGGVGIGQTSPLPVSTLGISDRTASTGVTRVIVEAGAGQSTTNLLEFQAQNAVHGSGTVYTAIGSTGLLSTYNSEVTAAVGQPYIRASASLTGQNAAITSGNLLANAAAGLYRVSAYMHTTSPPGNTCTATLVLGYAYNSGTKSINLINGHDLNTDENANSSTYTFRVNASSNITREVTVTGTCGAYTYDLFLTLERLQ